MNPRQAGREKRQAPRVRVLSRVSGVLAAVDVPITVHDLSRTGFSIVSSLAFQAGEQLDFRLDGPDGSELNVTAEAVHTRGMPNAPQFHLSGFRFVPGRLTGVLPQRSIDRLIEAVTVPDTSSMFERVPVAR